MNKTELFLAKPFLEENNVLITLTFSNVAKWTPEVFIEESIPIKDYLQFIENVMNHENTGNIPEVQGELNFSLTKTTAKMIFKDHYISFKLKDFYKIVKLEIEKLFISGVIQIS